MIYLNEHDPFAAKWCRELMVTGEIPGGTVDERDIQQVTAEEIKDFSQCHFFSGVAGWPLALRLAGWPDDRPVWTGSAPCQPYSAAGKGKGDQDARNLWPEFFRLICECRPDTIFGEQVASAIGHGWLDGIRRDLEGEGYAVGHCVLGAHSVQSPHIRQRLYWVAESNSIRHNRREDTARTCEPRQHNETETGPAYLHADGVADAGSGGREGRGEPPGPDQERSLSGCRRQRPSIDGDAGGMEQRGAESGGRSVAGGCGDNQSGAWSDYRIIQCSDGKARRVGCGVQPLADGIPSKRNDPRLGHLLARLGELGYSPKDSRRIIREARRNRGGRLKGYGNAIVPQLAAAFIMAYMQVGGEA